MMQTLIEFNIQTSTPSNLIQLIMTEFGRQIIFIITIFMKVKLKDNRKTFLTNIHFSIFNAQFIYFVISLLILL